MDSKLFRKRIRRGREFEKQERSYWTGGQDEAISFEAPTQWQDKRGRVDIRLDDTKEKYVVVVELKASNWDQMAARRVRPNVLRHARQLWRYVETELDVVHHDVLPGIIYPVAPKTPGRKEEIETVLEEQGIQVVWRTE